MTFEDVLDQAISYAPASWPPDLPHPPAAVSA